MDRDKRGYWKPVDKIQYQPIFQWPLNFKKIFGYFFNLLCLLIFVDHYELGFYIYDYSFLEVRVKDINITRTNLMSQASNGCSINKLEIIFFGVVLVVVLFGQLTKLSFFGLMQIIIFLT